MPMHWRRRAARKKCGKANHTPDLMPCSGDEVEVGHGHTRLFTPLGEGRLDVLGEVTRRRRRVGQFHIAKALRDLDLALVHHPAHALAKVP